MPPPRVSSRPAANKVFVNRERPFKVFEDAALAIPTDRAKLLVFYGIGGQGKTALCREFWRKIGADPTYRFLRRAELDLHGRPTSDPDLLLIWIRNGFAKAGVVFPCFDLTFAIAWDAARGDEAMPRIESGWLARRKEMIGGISVDLIKALGEVATGISVFGAVIRSVGGWTIKKGYETYLHQTRDALGELYRAGELKKPFELSALLPSMLAHDLNHHLATHPADRFVLFVDEYERVFDEGGAGVRWTENPFDNHMRRLVAETNGLLAIFFSRERLPWEANPDWRADLKGAQHLLGGLSDRDGDQFLRAVPIEDEPLRAAMIEGARETSTSDAPVYPLMLDLQVEHWYSLVVQAKPIELDAFRVAAPDFEGRRRELIDRVLRDYGQSLQVTLRRLSFARRFDRPAFEHVVKTFVTGLPLDAFETIAGMSFITRGEDGYLTIHGVVTEAIRELLDPETRNSSLKTLFDHYESRASFSSPREITDQTISYLFEAAYLRRQIGINGYVEWLVGITAPMEMAARHVACEQIWREALSFVENELGSNHSDALTCCLRLAYSLNGQKRELNAEPLIRKALMVSERELGQDHPITAAACSYLAHSLNRQRRHSEAEKLTRKALDIRKRMWGEDHADTAASYSSLAFILTAQKREKEAESFIRQALDIWNRLPGGDNSETANGYAVLAQNLLAQGRPQEAETFNRKALDIRRRMLGENNPQTATSYIGLSSSLSAQGREKEAEPFIRKALNIRERALGENHADTATAYLSLAYNFLAQRRKSLLPEAERLIRKALDIRQRVLGENHPDTATSYAILAQNLNAQRREKEAESFARKAVDINKEVLGEDHIDTANTYLSLSRNLTDQKRHKDAEPLMRKALDVRQRELGSDHPETLAAYVILAANLTDQRREKEAEAVLRIVLGIRERALGEEHPETVKSYLRLVNILTHQRRHQEAELVLRKIIDIRERVLGYEHQDTAAGYSQLAYNLGVQQREGEAEPLYRKIVDIRQRILGREHSDTLKVRRRLAKNLETQGRQEEAEAIYRDLSDISEQLYRSALKISK